MTGFLATILRALRWLRDLALITILVLMGFRPRGGAVRRG